MYRKSIHIYSFMHSKSIHNFRKLCIYSISIHQFIVPQIIKKNKKEDYLQWRGRRRAGGGKGQCVMDIKVREEEGHRGRGDAQWGGGEGLAEEGWRVAAKWHGGGGGCARRGAVKNGGGDDAQWIRE